MALPTNAGATGETMHLTLGAAKLDCDVNPNCMGINAVKKSATKVEYTMVNWIDNGKSSPRGVMPEPQMHVGCTRNVNLPESVTFWYDNCDNAAMYEKCSTILRDMPASSVHANYAKWDSGNFGHVTTVSAWEISGMAYKHSQLSDSCPTATKLTGSAECCKLEIKFGGLPDSYNSATPPLVDIPDAAGISVVVGDLVRVTGNTMAGIGDLLNGLVGEVVTAPQRSWDTGDAASPGKQHLYSHVEVSFKVACDKANWYAQGADFEAMRVLFNPANTEQANKGIPAQATKAFGVLSLVTDGDLLSPAPADLSLQPNTGSTKRHWPMYPYGSTDTGGVGRGEPVRAGADGSLYGTVRETRPPVTVFQGKYLDTRHASKMAVVGMAAATGACYNTDLAVTTGTCPDLVKTGLVIQATCVALVDASGNACLWEEIVGVRAARAEDGGEDTTVVVVPFTVQKNTTVSFVAAVACRIWDKIGVNPSVHADGNGLRCGPVRQLGSQYTYNTSHPARAFDVDSLAPYLFTAGWEAGTQEGFKVGAYDKIFEGGPVLQSFEIDPHSLTIQTWGGSVALDANTKWTSAFSVTTVSEFGGQMAGGRSRFDPARHGTCTDNELSGVAEAGTPGGGLYCANLHKDRARSCDSNVNWRANLGDGITKPVWTYCPKTCGRCDMFERGNERMLVNQVVITSDESEGGLAAGINGLNMQKAAVNAVVNHCTYSASSSRLSKYASSPQLPVSIPTAAGATATLSVAVKCKQISDGTTDSTVMIHERSEWFAGGGLHASVLAYGNQVRAVYNGRRNDPDEWSPDDGSSRLVSTLIDIQGPLLCYATTLPSASILALLNRAPMPICVKGGPGGPTFDVTGANAVPVGSTCYYKCKLGFEENAAGLGGADVRPQFDGFPVPCLAMGKKVRYKRLSQLSLFFLISPPQAMLLSLSRECLTYRPSPTKTKNLHDPLPSLLFQQGVSAYKEISTHVATWHSNYLPPCAASSCSAPAAKTGFLHDCVADQVSGIQCTLSCDIANGFEATSGVGTATCQKETDAVSGLEVWAYGGSTLVCTMKTCPQLLGSAYGNNPVKSAPFPHVGVKADESSCSTASTDYGKTCGYQCAANQGYKAATRGDNGYARAAHPMSIFTTREALLSNTNRASSTYAATLKNVVVMAPTITKAQIAAAPGGRLPVRFGFSPMTQDLNCWKTYFLTDTLTAAQVWDTGVSAPSLKDALGAGGQESLFEVVGPDTASTGGLTSPNVVVSGATNDLQSGYPNPYTACAAAHNAAACIDLASNAGQGDMSIQAEYCIAPKSRAACQGDYTAVDPVVNPGTGCSNSDSGSCPFLCVPSCCAGSMPPIVERGVTKIRGFADETLRVCPAHMASFIAGCQSKFPKCVGGAVASDPYLPFIGNAAGGVDADGSNCIAQGGVWTAGYLTPSHAFHKTCLTDVADEFAANNFDNPCSNAILANKNCGTPSSKGTSFGSFGPMLAEYYATAAVVATRGTLVIPACRYEEAKKRRMDVTNATWVNGTNPWWEVNGNDGMSQPTATVAASVAATHHLHQRRRLAPDTYTSMYGTNVKGFIADPTNFAITVSTKDLPSISIMDQALCTAASATSARTAACTAQGQSSVGQCVEFPKEVCHGGPDTDKAWSSTACRRLPWHPGMSKFKSCNNFAVPLSNEQTHFGRLSAPTTLCSAQCSVETEEVGGPGPQTATFWGSERASQLMCLKPPGTTLPVSAAVTPTTVHHNTAMYYQYDDVSFVNIRTVIVSAITGRAGEEITQVKAMFSEGPAKCAHTSAAAEDVQRLSFEGYPYTADSDGTMCRKAWCYNGGTVSVHVTSAESCTGVYIPGGTFIPAASMFKDESLPYRVGQVVTFISTTTLAKVGPAFPKLAYTAFTVTAVDPAFVLLEVASAALLGWTVVASDAYCQGGAALWHDIAPTIVLSNSQCGARCAADSSCNFYLWRYDANAQANGGNAKYTCAGFGVCSSTTPFSDGDGGNIYKHGVAAGTYTYATMFKTVAEGVPVKAFDASSQQPSKWDRDSDPVTGGRGVFGLAAVKPIPVPFQKISIGDTVNKLSVELEVGTPDIVVHMYAKATDGVTFADVRFSAGKFSAAPRLLNDHMFRVVQVDVGTAVKGPVLHLENLMWTAPAAWGGAGTPIPLKMWKPGGLGRRQTSEGWLSGKWDPTIRVEEPDTFEDRIGHLVPMRLVSQQVYSVGATLRESSGVAMERVPARRLDGARGVAVPPPLVGDKFGVLSGVSPAYHQMRTTMPYDYMSWLGTRLDFPLLSKGYRVAFLRMGELSDMDNDVRARMKVFAVQLPTLLARSRLCLSAELSCAAATQETVNGITIKTEADLIKINDFVEIKVAAAGVGTLADKLANLEMFAVSTTVDNAFTWDATLKRNIKYQYTRLETMRGIDLTAANTWGALASGATSLSLRFLSSAKIVTIRSTTISGVGYAVDVIVKGAFLWKVLTDAAASTSTSSARTPKLKITGVSSKPLFDVHVLSCSHFQLIDATDSLYDAASPQTLIRFPLGQFVINSGTTFTDFTGITANEGIVTFANGDTDRGELLPSQLQTVADVQSAQVANRRCIGGTKQASPYLENDQGKDCREGGGKYFPGTNLRLRGVSASNAGEFPPSSLFQLYTHTARCHRPTCARPMDIPEGVEMRCGTAPNAARGGNSKLTPDNGQWDLQNDRVNVGTDCIVQCAAG